MTLQPHEWFINLASVLLKETCEQHRIENNVIHKFVNTGLQTVSFINCKILGVNFTKCKDFLLSFSFEKCSLDYATFYEKKIIKTTFKNCTIKEVDFSFANLTFSEFINCDLSRSIFHHTILEKVDFLTAVNYSIDLEQNKVKKAKFSTSGIIGLLDKYQIIIEG